MDDPGYGRERRWKLAAVLLPLGLAACVSAGRAGYDISTQMSGTSLGQDQSGDHYYSLDQIKPGNVSRLQVAWTYETGMGGLRIDADGIIPAA